MVYIGRDIKNAFGEYWDAIKGGVDDVKEGIEEGAEIVGDGLNYVGGGIRKVLGNGIEYVGDKLGIYGRPIKGIGHYMAGSGEPLIVNFNSIDTSNVEIESFRKVYDSIKNRKNTFIEDKIGFTVNEKYNRLFLGSIRLVLKGSLYIQGDSRKFVGELSAKPDVYDFNTYKNPEESHRGTEGEELTRIGSYISGTEYNVSILGKKKIQKTGIINETLEKFKEKVGKQQGNGY